MANPKWVNSFIFMMDINQKKSQFVLILLASLVIFIAIFIMSQNSTYFKSKKTVPPTQETTETFNLDEAQESLDSTDIELLDSDVYQNALDASNL